MNFSKISDKTLIGKVLRFPLRFIPAEMKLPILQGKLRGKTWIAGTCNHGCWLGSFEYQKRLIFEKTVIKGSTVFDIGANVGFYTLLASVLVGPQGKVFAFEPVPRNLFYLNEHLRLNGITNVTVIDAAVSDRCDTVYFDEGPSSTMGHISLQGKLHVRTVCLDDLILKGEIPIPDFIKIDVEGAEVLVLSGAKSILTNAHPTLFLDIHGNDLRQQCYKFLECLYYKLQALDGNRIEQAVEILACRKN